MNTLCYTCMQPRPFCRCPGRWLYRGRHHAARHVLYARTACRPALLTRPTPYPVGRIMLGAGVALCAGVLAFGVTVPEQAPVVVPAQAVLVTATPSSTPPAPIEYVPVVHEHVYYRPPVTVYVQVPVVRKHKHGGKHDLDHDGDAK